MTTEDPARRAIQRLVTGRTGLPDDIGTQLGGGHAAPVHQPAYFVIETTVTGRAELPQKNGS